MTDSLNRLYDDTNLRTRSAWAAHPDTGARRTTERYAKDKFALATGITPTVTPAIAALLQDLYALTGDDPLADVMPLTSLHFTFLAISGPIYPNRVPPVDIASLTDAFAAITPLEVTIGDLRLVALPDQLLLAGTPDAASLASREAFVTALLASPWADALAKRYAGTPLPPPFWHSTLLRYDTERMPPSLREFFASREHARFGEVNAPLKLAMVNYNWSDATAVA